MESETECGSFWTAYEDRNYVYNRLRCRRFNSQAQLSSIAFELLCGSRKHASPSPSGLTPALSCGITQSVPRRSVQSTQRANIAASPLECMDHRHGPSAAAVQIPGALHEDPSIRGLGPRTTIRLHGLLRAAWRRCTTWTRKVLRFLALQI